MLPEMREKAVRRCRDCRFFVLVRGREEQRCGCMVSIPVYGTLHRRVPEEIPAEVILKLAGREGLQRVLAGGNPENQACGLFRPGIKGAKV
ncbi:MAG: hypothetical protein C4589_12470 [Peptococcaceae bacterium]|nr:MAG: hypothetical protein C4589_12470 [Peptococcaceae bacterium]